MDGLIAKSSCIDCERLREARDGDLPNLQRLAPVRSADNAPLRGCRVSPLRDDAWA